MVKVATTKEQRKLFFNLRKSKSNTGWLSRKELLSIAKQLSVKPEVVMEMERRMAGADTSFDAPDSSGTDARELSPSETIHEKNTDPSSKFEDFIDQQISTNNLTKSLNKLDRRSRDVLKARWLKGEKRSVQSVLKQYALTPARMKQIERAALKKMRAQLSESSNFV